MNLPTALWKISQMIGFSSLGRKIAEKWPLPVRVTVHGGQEMYVDLRSSIGRGLFATGIFDMEAIKPAIEELNTGSIFLDIGSNIGFYSVMALEKIGEEGRIYCFEIDPRPLRTLRKTISYNQIKNIFIIEAAVSNRDGFISFASTSENGHSHIDKTGEKGREVRSLKLDTWMRDNPDINQIDVIKIDVEGAEKMVLEGATDLIMRFKPIILCEADKNTAGAFDYAPQDLIAIFSNMGYETRWLEGVCTPTLLALPIRT